MRPVWASSHRWFVVGGGGECGPGPTLAETGPPSLRAPPSGFWLSQQLPLGHTLESGISWGSSLQISALGAGVAALQRVGLLVRETEGHVPAVWTCVWLQMTPADLCPVLQPLQALQSLLAIIGPCVHLESIFRAPAAPGHDRSRLSSGLLAPSPQQS